MIEVLITGFSSKRPGDSASMLVTWSFMKAHVSSTAWIRYMYFLGLCFLGSVKFSGAHAFCATIELCANSSVVTCCLFKVSPQRRFSFFATADNGDFKNPWRNTSKNLHLEKAVEAWNDSKKKRTKALKFTYAYRSKERHVWILLDLTILKWIYVQYTFRHVFDCVLK